LSHESECLPAKSRAQLYKEGEWGWVGRKDVFCKGERDEVNAMKRIEGPASLSRDGCRSIPKGKGGERSSMILSKCVQGRRGGVVPKKGFDSPTSHNASAKTTL